MALADPLHVQAITAAIDDLRHDEKPVRLTAFRKLGIIAEALGPTRTRNELIPYLCEFIDDEDEILMVMAESLSSFLPYVGGADHVGVLLGPLEILSGVGEACVRDKAVESILNISKGLNGSALEDNVVPMIRRLSQADWHTSRMSATLLCWLPYARSSEDSQQELRKIFVDHCRDSTPMVRRVACSQIGKMAEVMSYEHVRSDLVAAFTLLMADEQDSVRLLAMPALL